MTGQARSFVTVVSGVPRSGTSLMMRILAAGGIPSLSDGVRTPDAGNPLGYLELEAVKRLPDDVAWLARARGRAVKVIHRLVPELPTGAGAPAFRVVLMRRDLAQVVASQSALLAVRGVSEAETLPPDRLAEIFRAQLDACRAFLAGAPNVAALEVDFETLLTDPGGVCAAVDEFLGGGLDRRAMAAAVDPALSRASRGARYTPRAVQSVDLGPIRFVVEHRMPGPTGGPTLRVLLADDDRELLRFDCFAVGAHWHADPPGRDAVTRLPAAVDALEWTLAELRRDLAGYLDRAGLAATPPAAGAALDAVEVALRNPPPSFDDLDVALLRERRGEKWSAYPDDVLPLWVADMDYSPAEPIRRRLQRCLDAGDLGYPMYPRPTRIPALFARRARERFGWSVEPRRVELITDVVQGIYAVLHAFTEPGDGVVIQTPIYPPFLSAVDEMERVLMDNPLRDGEHGFEVDVAQLRRAATGAKVLLLCNPHNPTGRVFRAEELAAIAEVALQCGLVVVSDEIHGDLVYPGGRHIPFASLSPEAEARTITLTSASKAFNIAGLRCAVAIFGSDDLKKRFLTCPRHLRGGLGSFGIEATLEAWSHGDAWLARALAYLEANRDYVAHFVERELPGVRHHAPEATYLSWLDCRALELPVSPYAFFLREARVALSDGAAFGTPGEGFVRLNFATSRTLLADALQRMAGALRTR